MRSATTRPDTAVSAATVQTAAWTPRSVGDDAGEQRTDGEAAVAPEPVDADRAGAPGRVRHVADRGEQGGVDHRGAGAEQDRGDCPDGERVGERDQREGEGLEPHARDDQPLPAPPVGQGAGEQLPDAPHGRVERGQDADPADRQSGGGEQDREQTPGEAVVEVVHQSGLAGRGQGGLLEAGLHEHLTVGQLAVEVVVPAVGAGDVAGRLEAGVVAGLLDHQGRQPQAERGEGDAEEERLRAQSVGLGAR